MPPTPRGGCPTPTAAPERSQTEQKAKVVPAAGVVNFVDAHVVVENRDHEGDGGDDAMPEAPPESGHSPILVGRVSQFIRASRATGQHHQHEHQTYHYQ